MRGKKQAFMYTKDQKFFSFFKESSKSLTSIDMYSLCDKFQDLIKKITGNSAYGTIRFFRNGKVRFNVNYNKSMNYPDCLVRVLDRLVDSILMELNKKLPQSVIDIYVDRAFSYYHIYEKNNIKEIMKLEEMLC